MLKTFTSTFHIPLIHPYLSDLIINQISESLPDLMTDIVWSSDLANPSGLVFILHYGRQRITWIFSISWQYMTH